MSFGINEMKKPRFIAPLSNLVLIILLLVNTPKAISSEVKQLRVEVSLCLDSARFYFYEDYFKAYSFAQQGLERASPKEHVFERIGLLQITAEIEYFYLNDFYSSLIRLNEMRFLSDSVGYERGIPWFKLNLANVYYYQNDFDKALALFDEAMVGGAALGDSVVYINALCGKSDILSRKGDFDSAIELLDEGLLYAIRNNRTGMLLFLYDDLADIYKQQGQLDSSYSVYQRTYAIAQQENSAYWSIVSEINLEYGKYLMNSSYDPVPRLRALKEEAFSRAFYRQCIQIGNTLSEVLEGRGDFRDAFLETKSIESLKDSIYGMDGIRKVAELESQYHIHKAKLENLNLIRQNEINAVKLNSRKKILYIIASFLTLAVFLLIIILRKYNEVSNNIKTIKQQEYKIFEQTNEIIQKEKEVVEQKLIVQERELAGKLMQIYHHNQLLQKVRDNLNNVKEILTPENSPDLDSVRRKLQSITNEVSISLKEKLWDEFEKYFVEANPTFVQRLHSRHSDLTPNETRLCIFLFLNMRTKEISAITQQSVKSINVGRTRLRKKLGLDNTEIILSAYMKQL